MRMKTTLQTGKRRQAVLVEGHQLTVDDHALAAETVSQRRGHLRKSAGEGIAWPALHDHLTARHPGQ